MKRILILGAGGAVGIGWTRCLKDHYDVRGMDDGEFSSRLMECPPDTGAGFFDLHVPAHSNLVEKWSLVRFSDNGPHLASNPILHLFLLPPRDVVKLCADKAKTAEALGDLAPKTYWVRDTHGSGGKGAQMASEYLPGRNFAYESVWWEGKHYGHFAKERISYKTTEVSREVKGTAAVATCIDPSLVFHTGWEAIHRVTDEPHGIFTVDMKENEDGDLKVTEVNAGKFATSSFPFYYHYHNLPLRAVQLALGEKLTPLGDYPEGLTVIRGYDREPWIGHL